MDSAAPAPHRRITLERTHHLCSFVELSHFNPRLGPFGNQLHKPPPNAVPHSRAPPTPLQSCSCQHFHLCAAVVWCQVHTHTHFHQSYSTTGLPHVCRDHQVGWRGLFDVMSVCVPYIFTAIYEEKNTQKKINLLFKIFIFEGWRCWRSESRDLVAVLYYYVLISRHI